MCKILKLKRFGIFFHKFLNQLEREIISKTERMEQNFRERCTKCTYRFRNQTKGRVRR